jgi:CRISPR-associated protein Csx17
MEPLYLYGCRHDILGHYLKAIGLLRVLALCADEAHRDPDAEGWWDLERAYFCLRSPKYPTKEKLVDFFEKHYQPTPFFSPWNTGGGLNEKKEIEFSIPQTSWQEFWANNRDALLPLIADEKKRTETGDEVRLEEKPLKFTLSAAVPELKPHPDIAVTTDASKGKKPKPFVEFSWSPAALNKFFAALAAHRTTLEKIIKFTDAVNKKFVAGKPSLPFDILNEEAVALLPETEGVSREIRVKESGKKAVMAVLAKNTQNSSDLKEALNLGRSFFARFQEEYANERSLLEELRDKSPSASAEAFDSVFTTRVTERTQDSPLFLNRGDAGQAEVFRTFWVNLLETKDSMNESVEHGLIGRTSPQSPTKDGKGTPFFPDAIKAYNNGSGWVTENYPFNALDYVLAVEGGFAMRGSVGRTLAANSKRFAAFPFVFDSGDNMVDDGNEVKGTARALWFPLWNRPVTFAELSSFISDAQARLPGKDARFSAEFMRALHSQGVDAGFAGWQEFRFKMLISRVPWVTTGSYVESAFREDATRLNRALHPLDESHFLDQFEIAWKGSKASARSPHPVRTEINAAMETAVRETTPHNCLDLLGTVFRACRQMAISESFRDTLPGKRAHFFRPLPMEDWNALFARFDKPEFRIARAVASMVGIQWQQDGKYSKTLPTHGSILPLNLGPTGWYLATKGDRSHQAVWTGTDLCHDLAVVLGRRYMDSLTDDRPALVSAFGAPLGDVLAFLRGDLDGHLIARWTEALSLIEWRLIKVEEPAPAAGEWESQAIPPEYAALRTVLELECERREDGDRKKRRSQQPISLLCQRSASTLPLAVTEALRWVGIWGVPNPYGEMTVGEKKRLSGRDIISLPSTALSFSTDAARLAAAVCIPLHWRDRYALYRAVSLPQAD